MAPARASIGGDGAAPAALASPGAIGLPGHHPEGVVAGVRWSCWWGSVIATPRSVEKSSRPSRVLRAEVLSGLIFQKVLKSRSGSGNLSTVSEVDAVREAFVQLWGAMGPFWGISPTTARVHSYLLSRAEPADTEEIMHGLEMSRGAVSMACRELRDWGLIVTEKAPGSRRLSYRPATDLEKVVRNIVSIRKRREWDPILENLREWIPKLEAENSPEAAIFRERLKSLESLIGLADSMVEVVLGGGMVGHLGLKLLVKASRKQATGTTGKTQLPEIFQQLEETP